MAPDHLAQLVAEAVGRALDRRHGAMVREAAMIAVIASLAVILPVTLFQNHATAASSHANALRNCRTVRTLGYVVSEFLRSDAIDRHGQQTAAEKQQVLRAFGKILEPRLLARLNREQQQLDRYTIAYWQGPMQHAGPFKNRQPLLQRAQSLGDNGCERAIK